MSKNIIKKTFRSVDNFMFGLITKIIFAGVFILLINSNVFPQTPNNGCIDCPNDIIVNAEPGQCSAVVSYSISTRQCPPSATPVANMPSGSRFPVGSTTVVVRSVDPSTNIVYGECRFNVVVNDAEPPKISCPSNIIVRNDPGKATAMVNFPLPTATDNCGKVTVTSFPASGTNFPIGTTAVQVTATDSNGVKNFCTFNVTVTDNELPIISCPQDMVVNANAGECFAFVNYPAPSAQDNSQLVTVISSPLSGTRFSVGTTKVNVTATDRSGNVSQCSFNVTVKSSEPLKIVCPEDVIITAATNQCGATVNYPTPKVISECSKTTVNTSIASGSFFEMGRTSVTITAVDEFGNKDSCSFAVVVNSAQPPEFVCPEDMVISAPSGECAINVNYPPIRIANECLGTKVEYSLPSGSRFIVGTTPVTVTVTDPSGRKSSCTFNVKVSGKPQLRLTLEDDQQLLEFGTITAAKKPRKNPPFRLFTMENIGCASLNMAFLSMMRTGDDVSSGRISNPNDQTLFFVRGDSPDRNGVLIPMGSNLSLTPGERRNFYIFFNPVIPSVTGRNQNLTASQALPDHLATNFTITQTEGESQIIPLFGNVATPFVLIDPNDPRRTAKANFSKTGDVFVVEFSVYDSNLDLNRATFEFFTTSGQMLTQPVTVDLKQAIQEANLITGQSFTISQKFTGASSYPEITSVRVTMFDQEASGAISGNINSAPSNTLTTTSESYIELPVVRINSVNK